MLRMNGIIDTSLVQGYSPDLKPNWVRYPLSATYQHGDKRLHFIAASHSLTRQEKDRSITLLEHNPTLDMLDACFAESPPDIVLVELEDRFHTHNPPDFLEKSSALYSQGTEAPEGEISYAPYLANKHNIPFMGLEPTHQQLQSLMTINGYSDNDFMGLYAMRVMPQINEDGKSPKSDTELASILDNFWQKDDFFSTIPKDKRMTFATFQQWYAEKNTTNTHYAQFSTRDWMPLNDSSASYFNKASNDMGKLRDQAIFKKIGDIHNAYDNVLVVYGGTHYFCGKQALDSAYGHPNFHAPHNPPDAPSMESHFSPDAAQLQNLAASLDTQSIQTLREAIHNGTAPLNDGLHSPESRSGRRR